jgi:hypothetical protein
LLFEIHRNGRLFILKILISFAAQKQLLIPLFGMTDLIVVPSLAIKLPLPKG